MHANIQQGGMCDVILRDNLTMAVVPLGIEGPCFQQNEPHLAMGAMSQPKHTPKGTRSGASGTNFQPKLNASRHILPKTS